MQVTERDLVCREVMSGRDVLDDPSCWQTEHAWRYLRQCSELRGDQPLDSLHLAEVGLLLVERCPPDAALSCFARAVLASALRVVGRFDDAEATLGPAVAEIDRIPAEIRAEILPHLAFLRCDQGRLSEALALIDDVCHFHRTHGREPDLHKFGLASMARCLINYSAGATVEALHDIGVALKNVDSTRSPEDFAAAIHNLAWLLQESNHPKDLAAAAGYVKSVFRLGRLGRRSVSRAKLYWLQGLIGLRLGAARHAERNFRLAREIFAEQEMACEVALVALDLGSIYFADGRWPELAELAEEIGALVGSERVVGEVATALELWREAVATQRVTAQLHERAREALLARTTAGFWDVGARRPAAGAQPQR